ncbi:exodeoxyribonuclease VII small subunit [Solwaraspora sp. WMMD406]|uniref:exodeoxyribonuclease VII small subunit n=1 Tax=Solwaraspora sp. WMMD406 TaxID=3016095 RepID=UPI00241672FD|nr:exodeoxyribonuclease VII small subunit [Solwaraspora sp. WMMD406]MDG4767819.1 exodeoxyribonuclease VII small subunit [Solwaraspora sp. WMMD406]
MSSTKKAAAGDDPAADSTTAETMSYEQARAELASVVERLESGGTSLEESLALWERGERLAGICQRWLDGARERLEIARAARSTDT